MVGKKNSNGKHRKLGDHRPEEEDGEVFNEPWMWEDEDKEQTRLRLQQDPGKDLTPRDDDARD